MSFTAIIWLIIFILGFVVVFIRHWKDDRSRWKTYNLIASKWNRQNLELQDGLWETTELNIPNSSSQQVESPVTENEQQE